MSATENGAPFGEMVETLKKAVAALRDAKVPHLLGGGLAIWARGGPERDHDLDFMVKEEDAERALQGSRRRRHETREAARGLALQEDQVDQHVVLVVRLGRTCAGAPSTPRSRRRSSHLRSGATSSSPS